MEQKAGLIQGSWRNIARLVNFIDAQGLARKSKKRSQRITLLFWPKGSAILLPPLKRQVGNWEVPMWNTNPERRWEKELLQDTQKIFRQNDDGFRNFIPDLASFLPHWENSNGSANNDSSYSATPPTLTLYSVIRVEGLGTHIMREIAIPPWKTEQVMN